MDLSPPSFYKCIVSRLLLAMGCGLSYENRNVTKHTPVKRDHPVVVEHQANPHAADASELFSETVIINLDEMTDAEIENLMGWNYNINTYTTGAYKLGDNR